MYIIFSCRRLGLEDIVVMDNLSAHKDQQAISMIESVGAEVWFFAAVFAGPEPHRKDVEQS